MRLYTENDKKELEAQGHRLIKLSFNSSKPRDPSKPKECKSCNQKAEELKKLKENIK